MNTQSHKRCWVLDDEWGMYPKKIWGEALNTAGYQIEWVSTATEFVRRVGAVSRNDGDIALIDFNLDNVMPGDLRKYDQVVQQNLLSQGKYITFHGQAVGLWLWDQRQQVRLPYAYISSHAGLFCAGLMMSSDDLPEFDLPAGIGWQDAQPLICLRGEEGPIVKRIDKVQQHWRDKKWIQPAATAATNQGSLV